MVFIDSLRGKYPTLDNAEGKLGGGGDIPDHLYLFFPQNVDEGIAYGQELVANNAGWIYIPPFDDPLIW